MAQQPLLYETHSHTPLCKHAEGTPGEYAATAQTKGLAGLIVTCHNPLPDGLSASVRMGVEQFPHYLDLVAQTREEWKGKVDVLLGMECDFLPGLEPWLEELHSKAEFHYILGSVHPHLREYKERYFTGDPQAFLVYYYGHLAQAAETGLFDSLAHPDLVKNVIAEHWNAEAALEVIRPALDRIAKTGIAMELNTSGLNKVISEMNPGPVILKEIQARGIPVVIGADAHTPKRVGDQFEKALGQLKEIGFECVSGFRNRQRYEIPIDAALAQLRGN